MPDSGFYTRYLTTQNLLAPRHNTPGGQRAAVGGGTILLIHMEYPGGLT